MPAGFKPREIMHKSALGRDALRRRGDCIVRRIDGDYEQRVRMARSQGRGRRIQLPREAARMIDARFREYGWQQQPRSRVIGELQERIFSAMAIAVRIEIGAAAIAVIDDQLGTRRKALLKILQGCSLALSTGTRQTNLLGALRK